MEVGSHLWKGASPVEHWNSTSTLLAAKVVRTLALGAMDC